MTNYVSYTSKKLLTSWVETVRNFSWIYKFSLRREQKRITKYVSKSYTKRLLQWVGTWTPDLKLQLPMRKLKLIPHTNQLEGLSTSRHATWFRHVFFSAKTWSDGKCQEKLKIMLMQNLEPISIKAENVNRKWKKKKKEKKKKNASQQ